MMINVKRMLLGSWGCGLLLTALILSGCGTGSSEQKFSNLPGFTEDAPMAGTPTGVPPFGGGTVNTNTGELDRLRTGDTITITFSDLPQLQQPLEERIKDDGTITLLLNQTFMAAGKTRGELEREIREAYVPRYYVNMTVSVKLQRDTQFYFVGGEVKLPNRQVYISRVTVLKAIQSAGDFTDFAKKKAVVLTRADGRKITINCVKAREDANLDLEVYPGDQIWVPRKIF